MIQCRGEACFTKDAAAVSRAGCEKLDGDDAFESGVVGAIDRAHAPRAEWRVESVVAEHLASHRAVWFEAMVGRSHRAKSTRGDFVQSHRREDNARSRASGTGGHP